MSVEFPGTVACANCGSIVVVGEIVDRLAASEQAREKAEAGLRFYKDRERHFAKALQVADGGQYRADWNAAIEDMIKRCNRAEARLAAAEKVVEAARRIVERLSIAFGRAMALRDAIAEYDAVRAGDKDRKDDSK